MLENTLQIDMEPNKLFISAGNSFRGPPVGIHVSLQVSNSEYQHPSLLRETPWLHVKQQKHPPESPRQKELQPIWAQRAMFLPSKASQGLRRILRTFLGARAPSTVL